MNWAFKKIFILSVLFFIISEGCKTAPEKKESIEKEEKKEVPAAEETHGLTKNPVKGIDNLEVLSSSPGEASKISDNTYLILIPIGAEAPMKCSYIKGNDSPVYILKDFFEKLKERSDVENFEISNFSTGVMGKIPMISTRAVYQMSNKVTGNVETISLSTLGFVIFCYIEQDGFSEPFTDAVKSISESKLAADLLARIKKYIHREIYSVKLNDSIIGYSENYIFETGKDEINYYMINNYFINQDAGKIYVGEIIEDMYSDKKSGFVSAAKYYSSQNNTQEYKLDLKETSPGNYSVKGTFKGTAFEKNLTSDKKTRIIAADFLINKTSKESKSSTGKTIKLLQFHAAYPEQLMDSEIHVQEIEDKSAKLSYRSGPVTLDYETDKLGTNKISMKNENIQMLWERIYSE